MKQIHFNLKSLLENNRFLWVVSVIIALCSWFFVALSISPNTEWDIERVPIALNEEATALTRMGLYPVDFGERYATVKIRGRRNIVGNIHPNDIEVTVDLTGVTGASTYDLTLRATNVSDRAFEIVEVTPKTTRVQFERHKSQRLPVEANITGIEIPEGYIMEQEYVTPDEVTITGSDVDVARVARAVVQVELDEPLERTTIINNAIELYDQEGNLLDLPNLVLSAETADVTIPVLQRKEVPVVVDFINVPKYFPIESLSYTLSKKTIEVAGPVDEIDAINEVSLGYIDIKQMGLDSAYDFPVELPDGFLNIENIQAVRVEIDTSGMISRNFYVTDIRLVNKPANYDVTVYTKQLTVQMIGPEEIINSMTAKDIVAEIDISDRELTPGDIAGDITTPVKVYAPSKGLVWAVNDYSALISIKERSS